MEENVALDSKKQKKFDKSIKGIKKLLKKNVEQPPKPLVLAPKDDESKSGKKRKRRERGLVYLSHIPHGFYEHEMTQYFKQFGMVTNVRVIRSPRTGRSKGFAFVEFKEPAVAEIVAETMNNYLMGKRLIKAAIVPPEKQRHRAFRKHWTTMNNPTVASRNKHRKDHNAAKTDSEHLKKAKKMLSQLQAKKKKLSDLGIDYDFFTPVDVPAELLDETQTQVKSENKKTKVKNEPEVKKVKKESETKKNKNDQDVKQNKNKKTLAKETEQKSKEKKVEPKQSEVKNKNDAKNSITKQNDKQKKMQDAGVKLPENFIQVGEESGDESDSSLDFDSDEYEKMLANEDSDASSREEEDEDEDEDGSEDEVSEEELPPLIPIKEKKDKKPIVAAPAHGQKRPTTQQLQKKGPKGQNQKKQIAATPPLPKQAKPPQGQKGPNPQGQKAKVPQPQKPQPQAMKRKNQQPEASPKKPKFEKKDKPRNKQFKKKNKA